MNNIPQICIAIKHQELCQKQQIISTKIEKRVRA